MTLVSPLAHIDAAPTVGELQVRLPVAPAPFWLVDELLDAFETDLDHTSQFLDGVETEGAEVCVYLYGSDPARLVATTRRVLDALHLTEGAYALHTPPGPEGPSLTERLAL